MKERLGIGVGAIVTLVWATMAVVGSITGEYRGLEYVTPVMMLVTGWLFGIEIVRRKVNAEALDEEGASDRWSHLP